MIKAFVFGKFMPFHKGHQAMIAFAAMHCDELIVVPCVSDCESLPGILRKAWIEKTFAANTKIKVSLLNYMEDELPNSSVSSEALSKLWAEKFKSILPDVNLLVTSEPYGEFVANFMGIKHLPFDLSRTEVPVSATKIRNNPYENWDFLPDAVKPHYQRKVVILGTESTGKTSLAEYLSTYFNAALVREMGRELIPDSEKFVSSFGRDEDLERVAAAHQRETELAIQSLKPLIVMDTDIHITQSYAFYKFGKYLNLPEVWYRTQKADLYLYLPVETPYVQDGTRLSKNERDELDQCHRDTLKKFELSYERLDFDFNLRAERSVKSILEMFN
jgi:HTH-type transcriptional repressor of NAD biosynthesis genes